MLQFEFNFLNTEDTRALRIGEEAEKKVDARIQRYFRQASLFAREVYEREAPPTGTGTFGRTTGALKDALERSRVTKGADGNWGFTVGVPPIDTGGSPAESFYPLYVEKGTKGPIFAQTSNVLALRDKSKGRRIFAFKESVRGQRANNYFGRMNTAVSFMFFNPRGKAYLDLRSDIDDIVEDAMSY